MGEEGEIEGGVGGCVCVGGCEGGEMGRVGECWWWDGKWRCLEGC